MSQHDAEAVRAAYATLAEGDAEPYLALFDERGEFVEPDSMPYGGTYRGHEGLTDLFAAIDQTWDGLHFEVQQVLDAGDHLVVISRARGRARATGRTIDEVVTEVLRMKAGKIVSSRSSVDTARVLAALAA